MAADWQFDQRISLGSYYNDNYRLTPISGTEIEVFGPEVDALLTMRAVGPTTTVTIVPRLHSVYFPDDKDQDSNDQFLTFEVDHKGQKGTAGLVASYQREDTVNSELPNAATDLDSGGLQLGTITNRDSGLLTLRNRRELFRVQPNFTYQFNTRYSVAFSTSYEDAAYDNTLVGGQVDYRNVAANLGLQFATSPTTQTSVSLFGSRYDPDIALPEAATYGADLEWRKNVSATQQYYLRAGVADTRINPPGAGPSTSDTGFVAGAGVRWSYERTNLFLDYVRDVSPNASGTVVNRDEVRVYLGRRLRPQLQGFVSALGSRDSQAGFNVGNDERKYVTLAAGFDWRFSREYSLAPHYEYRWQKYSVDPDSAKGNSFVVSIVYEPRKPVQ